MNLIRLTREIIFLSLLLRPVVSFLAPAGSVALGCGGKLAKPLCLSSPQTVDKDKEEVTEYFNNSGFERWNKIYSESEEVNKVQRDIRDGHAVTIEKVLKWVDDDGSAKGLTICDAGCGVGSLSIPLAQRGATVEASDISSAMTAEAERRSKEILGNDSKNIRFKTSDLESLSGNFHTVCCIDVMIHYPTQKMSDMVDKLCGMAEQRVILSFAPDTWYYTLLKKFGSLFPGPSKTTRAYLHREDDVVKALEEAGFEVKRTEFTGTNFYFSNLLEATRKQ
mmetsp:Transcript_10169/g.14381  ORF Transcript_10169/g.14381 Transcript_10169/m.14381 type:complete len:279 (-) Transcript_10169:98-934(-)